MHQHFPNASLPSNGHSTQWSILDPGEHLRCIMSHLTAAEIDASHRSRITLRVGSQFTGSREKIGDQDLNFGSRALFLVTFIARMPPKHLQIHRWGWQLTSQLIIKAEIDALQIQIQKLQIEPGVVIHPITPAFRGLKKVGESKYSGSKNSLYYIVKSCLRNQERKKIPRLPKTKPYSLDGRPKMEWLLWIRSLPQVYSSHL